MLDYCFIEDNHEHRIDGVKIPGVTGMLAAEGFVDTQWYTEWTRDRGRIVHRATHLLDMDTLDWDSVDPRIEGYLRAYETFKADTGFEVAISEKPMCSFTYRFGTIPDKVGKLNGSVADIDLKTGKVMPWVGLQTAAQVIALKEFCPEYKGAIVRRYGLELKEDGKYSITEFKDRNDGPIFLSALACHNWKLNNRR